MSVTVTDEGVIVLAGVCPIDDADALLRRLIEAPGAAVDWSECLQAHSAVVQVLMAAAPRFVGLPTEPFLRNHLAVLLNVPASAGALSK